MNMENQNESLLRRKQVAEKLACSLRAVDRRAAAVRSMSYRLIRA